MADEPGATARLMAEFLEFKAAQEAAAAQDNDPDNERDVTIQRGETVLTLPWRKAKEYDLDGMLEGFGLKRKPKPAAAEGGGADGGKEGESGGSKKPAAGVRSLFPQAGGGKAASGS
jgi:hypothetical protein